LLGVEEVEAAMHRHIPRDTYEWAQKRLGVDVARFGDDRTVIFPRQGLAAFRPVIMRAARTTAIATRVARANLQWHPELIFIDDTGHWGHGVVDLCITAGLPIVPLQYHSSSPDPRYGTLRDYIWCMGADWVKGGAALPNMPDLVPELVTPTYTFAGGKFIVEPKDEVKKRLGRSPDLADALFETHAYPDLPGEVMMKLRGSDHALTADNYERTETHRALIDDNPFNEPGIE
jgi:hypothetical protein